MRDKTTKRDSLTIDDLVVGQSYEFITPHGRIYRGVWAGIDRHNAAVDLPPGEFDLFPHGVMLVRPVRFWASCTITAMEPLHVVEERLDLADAIAESRTADAVRARPWRVGVMLAALLVAAAAAWLVWR